MDSWFHIVNLTANRDLTSYQRSYIQTIARPALAAILTLFLLSGVFGGICPAQTPGGAQDSQGFAPPTQNLLYPLLKLAPPGQASQALWLFEQIHGLDRKIILHPALSPELQNLLDSLPAAEVIPIEMPSLYASFSIPWRSHPPDIHYLAVGGRPNGDSYVYGLSEEAAAPQEPGRLGAALSVAPQPHGMNPPAGVVAKIKGSLYISGVLQPSSAIDAALGFEHEIYGSLAAPWDQRPGIFNQHDRAALARMRRDLPATFERVDHYLEIHNVLDEFDGPSGPWVLFNLDAEVREPALAPFPHLRDFWRDVAGRIDAQSVTRDEQGRRWMLHGLHRGHITMTFMLRRGALAPMDAELRPAGPPLAIDQIRTGQFHTDSTVSIDRFGMRFGMKGIGLATSYTNRYGAIGLDSHMTGVPQLIAPPVIQPLTMLLAGEFIQTLAQGNGGRGVATSFSASHGPQGGTMLGGSISAELRDADALRLLARMAAAFAPNYGAQVREEQRRLTAEFFAAFESDYRRARPALLGGGAAGIDKH